MTGSAVEHAALLDRICSEIHLAQRQVRRSREVRSKYGVVCGSATDCAVDKLSASSLDVKPRQVTPPVRLAGTPCDRRLSPYTSEAHSSPAWARKEGTLLHLERRVLGRERFVSHFVVIDEHEGILWYQDKKHSRTASSRPLGHVPFWKETRNSRGSRFKRAAVCWPLILPEDCSKADDPHKTYFAIEYLNDRNNYSKLIFAAESAEERDAWVFFITQFLEMFLPLRAESEGLKHLPRGAVVPRHCSEVIYGEPPCGNVL
ncbi:hypothetical protein TraAM80_00527 [Trypanosoma rangeli]|uniref:PH domain-containing protein n=1 Tax=Trypanosoma rangeli TaxID=5698 RepID=A0A3R7P3C4_TRYRA|nr:uncharacterized protein TraAM80_00527 [Trypanosoma rangeli]RNF12106.1 hypothetical protein TraAM80_00527 [Trypanosoma rangeli]|eukprot:RNF12106.1 hypothetical protein TraAM80_00527 [Trypanosoma rangeli]